jgi:DNA-directed RNA polymerase subunit K/omega
MDSDNENDDYSLGADIENDLDEQQELQEKEDTEKAVAQITQREIAKESKVLQILNTHHPECRLDYREEVLKKLPLQSYPPGPNIYDIFDVGGNTWDIKKSREATELISKRNKNHRSVPYLTIFEKTKILGFRANQLAQGSMPFINPVPSHITDVLEIASLELEQRLLPYILKRPMPDGSFEYIRLSDLLIM